MTRARRPLVMATAAALLVGLQLPVVAQEAPVSVTTPYPAVAVEAAGTATFDLQVSGPDGTRVGLEVTEVPDGWTATLRGGGFVVDAVTVDTDEPPEVQLDVEVPPDAPEGDYRVVVTAGPGTALTLNLRVAEAVAGGVTLEAEFPSLQGPSDSTYTFNLELTNDTPEETTFSLQGTGPEGWQVDVRPAGQSQAATATVAGGDTAALSVSVDPPDDVPAAAYPVLVRVVGGGQTAETELVVEIAGTFSMLLITPDERLNADVVSGTATDVPLLLINDGTAPLLAVELTATPPSGWEVSFTPATVDVLPGETVEVTATFVPSEEAVAGDYFVTLRASVPETNSVIDIRTTVKTSALWGIVGLALIAAVIVGVGWVFRRYGRR